MLQCNGMRIRLTLKYRMVVSDSIPGGECSAKKFEKSNYAKSTQSLDLLETEF